MLESCQIGLTVLPDTLTACLIVLGDQPQMRGENVRKILETYPITVDTLVLPSYSMRRGHPWLVGRKYWGDVMALRTPQSLRDFLRTHSDAIRYVMVDDDSILNDIDTPEDYASQRPMSPGK
jgi:CTP:molybdopterin cytidylyltransferase MocA